MVIPITSGGGGLISMNNIKDYNLATHLSSQAKDAIQFIHDDVGFNFVCQIYMLQLECHKSKLEKN